MSKTAEVPGSNVLPINDSSSPLMDALSSIQPILASFAENQKAIQEKIGPSLESLAKATTGISSSLKEIQNISEPLKKSFEQYAELSKKMSENIQPIFDESKEFFDALKSISETINRTVDIFSKFKALSPDELKEIDFISTNWSQYFVPFPIGASPSEVWTHFSNQKEADDFFDKFTTEDDYLQLKADLLSIKSVPVENVNECISDFESQRYSSCMFFLLSFIDNIIITNQKDNNPNKRALLPSQIKKLLEPPQKQYIPMCSLVFKTYQKNLELIYEYGSNFCQSSITIPKRNYVDHGMGNYISSKRDCLKIMTLVSYSLYFFDSKKSPISE